MILIFYTYKFAFFKIKNNQPKPYRMQKIKTFLFFFGILVIPTSTCFSQTIQTLNQVNGFIKDALYYSDNFITPATDGAVYQSSSSWMTSAKKRKLWDVTLGLHMNVFFVPNSDKDFTIKNSDFSFLSIENGTSATVPTAIGSGTETYLVGQLDSQQIRIKAPKGIDQSTVFYPHLSGGIALWGGTEFLVKLAPKTKLKHGDFQVYGFGLKHNISQYFKGLEAKKINIAALACYSNENISFDFLDVTTATYGNLGINRITGLVNTWQFQVNASKEFKKFELITGLIANTSDFKYKLTGDKGPIETFIPIQGLLNDNLKSIYKTRANVLGEISGRYQFSKIYVQTTIAFGKFVNSNVSVQYEFN